MLLRITDATATLGRDDVGLVRMANGSKIETVAKRDNKDMGRQLSGVGVAHPAPPQLTQKRARETDTARDLYVPLLAVPSATC
ncbi:MAG TPA: hypothetical protein VK511_03395, partial [Gemmatimonadaceae bacterium]|nr:hypothetical protein [Gemmatimonadaceae bacterium]